MSENCSVVLGASGFIGTRLVRRLASRGVEVRALDVAEPRERLDNVLYEQVDIRRPIASELGSGASVLYNLAAIHRTPGHPDREYYETNVTGALNATSFAQEASIATIVFTSSISVYGPSEGLLTEASALTPVSPYGRSKRIAEIIHERWLAAQPNRRLVVVRPGVVFGPGERGNYTALARALRSGYFFYPGRRDTVKSGGYVDELLSALQFVLSKDERFTLFNFSYPDANTTEQIVQAFSETTGLNSRRPTVPLSAMLGIAAVFEGLAKLGLRTPIHRERVLKLVRSTRVEPSWLLAHSYKFETNLPEALARWSSETGGTFD